MSGASDKPVSCTPFTSATGASLHTAAPAEWASTWALGTTSRTKCLIAAASWANIIFGAYSGVCRRALLDLLLNLTVTLKALTEMVPHNWPVHMQIKNYDFTKPGFNATTAAFTWVSL